MQLTYQKQKCDIILIINICPRKVTNDCLENIDGYIMKEREAKFEQQKTIFCYVSECEFREIKKLLAASITVTMEPQR